MNEVDSWLLLPLCILYEMQNQIFQHTKDPNLNAITTNPLVLESDNISTAKINVQPTNIRSWKRIMCQANPTGATDTLDLEKKRKVSTCMASTLEFPYKRMQMLDDKVLSDLMVEATVQPRQKPWVS